MSNLEPKFGQLSQTELNTLYNNFSRYRDNECNGMALMTVFEFFDNYGLSKHAAIDKGVTQ